MISLYRFFGNHDDLLYIGIAGNPGRRFDQHSKSKNWWSQVVRASIDHFPDRATAQSAERQAIQDEQPRYNVVHQSSDVPVDVVVDAWGRAARDLDLSDLECRVLGLIVAKCDRKGRVRRAERGLKDLPLFAMTVSSEIPKAMKRLADKGIIRQIQNGVVEINPRYFFMGEDDERNEAVANSGSLIKPV